MKNLQIHEIEKLAQISRILSETPFYAGLGAGGVLAIYLTAMELGLPVMYCLNGGLYNVKGKVSLSGQAINMMLINAGWRIEFLRMDETECHLKFISPNNVSINEFRFTIEDAKKAGYFGEQGINGTMKKLPKDSWVYFTKDMLFNRCISSGGRKFAPHVLGNCYGMGELPDDDEILPNKITELADIKRSKEFHDNKEPEKIEIKGYGLDDVEQFKERHNIKQGEKIYDYVINIAEKSNVPVDQVLSQAFLNEEKFINSFQRIQEKTL